MGESRVVVNTWRPAWSANTMASRWRASIGKRLVNTTCDTFRSIPTDENGAIAKVGQYTPNLTSCGSCTRGVTRSSRMRSRFDLSETRTRFPLRAHVDLSDRLSSNFHAERCNIFGRNGQLDQRMQSLDRGLAAFRRNNQIHRMR